MQTCYLIDPISQVLQELLSLQTSYVVMERPQVLLPLQDAGILARFVNISPLQAINR
jgi:hypothetical protein